MWDASSYKLYKLKDDMTQIFKHQRVPIEAVKIITKPRRFSKLGQMTFVIPDQYVAIQSKLLQPLELAMGYKINVILDADFIKEKKQESNFGLDTLSDIFNQGENDAILRGEIMQDLKVIQNRHVEEKPLKDPTKLSVETILALYRIAKKSARIMGSSPSSLEDTLFATFDKSEQAILKAAAKWNPIAAVNNRVSKKLSVLLSYPQIMQDIIVSVKNDLGQTCLQIAMINKHNMEISMIIDAMKTIPNFDIPKYLDGKDNKGQSHWDVANKFGIDLQKLIHSPSTPPRLSLSPVVRPLTPPHPNVEVHSQESTFTPAFFKRPSGSLSPSLNAKREDPQASDAQESLEDYCRHHPDKIDDLITHLASLKTGPKIITK